MSYGLGGAGLSGFGMGQKQDAMQAAGQSAEIEQRRNMENQTREQQRKAGNASLGAMGGALAGMAMGGPIGGLIGGVVGALGSRLF
jgi:uncharacterized membrane protein